MPRLKDMQIKLISLVHKGANQKQILYKGESFNERAYIKFSKSDDERGVVYGIVYAPDETDTQGDSASSEEICKASYTFMKSANLSACVDVNHDMKPADAYICESWIVKTNDSLFNEVGAWAVGIKLDSSELKELVKSGEITGLSMFGTAMRDEVAKSDETKSLLVKILDILKGDRVEKPEVNTEEVKEPASVQKQDELSQSAQIGAMMEEINALKSGLEELKASIAKMQVSKQDTSVNKDEPKAATFGIL